MLFLSVTAARCWAGCAGPAPPPAAAGCWAGWCSACTDQQNCDAAVTSICTVHHLLHLHLPLLHLLSLLLLPPTSSWVSWWGGAPGRSPAPHSRPSSERRRWSSHSDSRLLCDWRPGCWQTWGRSSARLARTGRRWSTRWRRRPGSVGWRDRRQACSCSGGHCRHWGDHTRNSHNTPDNQQTSWQSLPHIIAVCLSPEWGLPSEGAAWAAINKTSIGNRCGAGAFTPTIFQLNSKQKLTRESARAEGEKIKFTSEIFLAAARLSSYFYWTCLLRNSFTQFSEPNYHPAITSPSHS